MVSFTYAQTVYRPLIDPYIPLIDPLWTLIVKIGRKKRFLGQIFGQIFDFSRKSPKFVNRTTSLSGVQIFREIRKT